MVGLPEVESQHLDWRSVGGYEIELPHVLVVQWLARGPQWHVGCGCGVLPLPTMAEGALELLDRVSVAWPPIPHVYLPL